MTVETFSGEQKIEEFQGFSALAELARGGPFEQIVGSVVRRLGRMFAFCAGNASLEVQNR